VILVQPADGYALLRLLQLPVDHAVIGAAARLDGKTAETPQLPLGTETMWGLQDAKCHGRPNRAHGGNFTEPLPGRVLRKRPVVTVSTDCV